MSLTSTGKSARTANPVQTHARQLRALLESLDDVQRSRAQIVERARRRVDVDDITPRILKAAAAIERWVEVQPSMFEDVLDEELAKFEKFRDDIEEAGEKQEVLLDSIKVRHPDKSIGMSADGKPDAYRRKTKSLFSRGRRTRR